MNSEHPSQAPDLDNEYRTSESKMPPTFLLVLLALTGLNVVYNLFSNLKDTLFGGEKSVNMEAEVYQAIDESGVDLSDMPQWVMTGLMDFITTLSANMALIRTVDIVYYIFLGAAAFLMFKLRMVGFYLYVVVNVLGVLVTPVLYGFNFIGIAMAIMYAIIAIIFIALYAANRKHLS
ncbi:MAG: hypothetical protein EA392_14750 [Cryomorphaceae bacterium]|nr:MAG: hypothetical protein EA392_14750 [Cryomorphaceae bacterium]